MREIRQNPTLFKKIQFFYSGSIGLENVVSRFNGSKFINDLMPIQITPLNYNESIELIKKIIDNDPITFNDKALEYLLEEISWWIPFYFNLIMDEVDKKIKESKVNLITENLIDLAINSALKLSVYFKPWYERLRTAYKGHDFSFVKDILNILSDKKLLTSSEIINRAIKYQIEESYSDIMNALKHDGYVNNNDDPNVYRFNSPLLRKWWYCNVAN